MSKELAIANTKPIDVPMLPHERARLDEMYLEIIREQEHNAAEFNKAIDESSETFHDNAPMEAIRDHQNFYTLPRAKEIMRLARNALVTPYPAEEELLAVPGSVVDLVWEGESEPERYALIYHKLAETDYPEDDITGISVDSPLGKIIRNAAAGEVEGEIHGSLQKMAILSICQNSLVRHFSKKYDLNSYS